MSHTLQKPVSSREQAAAKSGNNNPKQLEYLYLEGPVHVLNAMTVPIQEKMSINIELF